ncbi:MAG: DUF1028 domain-containing protein [Trueperaceae bacterium]|nr:DUF1028 domain-containing protein [Trueperaceae bacterium]
MHRSPTVSTFSIVARDPETGDLAIATASKFLAVGAVVPYALADVGAVATQSHANTTFGPRTIDALMAGIPLGLIDEAFQATDPEIAQRQYGLVDAQGDSITFTGEGCHPWAGGIAKPDLAVQGNLLTGPAVVDALVAGFEGSAGAFPERLLAGLAAADAAGGDRRGRQSAALLVVREYGGYGGLGDRYIDLRVDDDPDPIGRLRAHLELHRLLFERPDHDELLAIEGEVAARLLHLLRAAGEEPGDAWGERAEASLRSLAGIENVEERMVDPGRIDPVVLRHLEERFGG